MYTDKLYPQVYEWSNLLLAHAKAAKGKRGKAPAACFEFALADNLIELEEELRAKIYRPGPYTSFTIYEPKRRLISAAPFRDRVVHHALCNIIEPLFERRFIADSYANRIGKGTHRAIDRCQQFARRYQYALQCDVRQFFPSLDHTILRKTLARVIRDDDVLWLCDQILDSGVGVLSEQYDMVYFPGDDLTAVDRHRGLPIGNLTSQFWANCYLDPFDHFVKRELRCKAFIRYVDDVVLFADDKATLWAWKRAVIERLATLRLTIHEERAQVMPVTQGIPWLGFVVYPDHRLVKRRKVVNFRRRLAQRLDDYHAGRISYAEFEATVRGWINHVSTANSHGLRRAILSDVRV
jgi:RNA-directed DNA polymerase